MSKILLTALSMATISYSSQCQSVSDTNFVTEIVHFAWIPDNANILLYIIKIDKSHKLPPESRMFVLNLTGKKLDFLLNDARSCAPSPDGKFIAYVKRLPDGKSEIYLYDRGKQEHIALANDTEREFAPEWSPDIKQLVYNIIRNGIVDICIIDIASRAIRQITQSSRYSSYNPVWSPGGDRIVYYLEKGDSRDQVYLTDPKGSFHNNLTNDTSAHNFYPSWLSNDKIIHSWSLRSLAIMNSDGSNRTKIDGIDTFLARFSPSINKLAYITFPPGSNLMIYDWKNKTRRYYSLNHN